jgi:hypothetical protein
MNVRRFVTPLPYWLIAVLALMSSMPTNANAQDHTHMLMSPDDTVSSSAA